MGQAQQVPQLLKHALAAFEAHGKGRHAEGGVERRFQHGGGLAEDAALAPGTGQGQELAGQILELAAASQEVPVREAEGEGGLLVAVSFQDPQQQCRQVSVAVGWAQSLLRQRAQQGAQSTADPEVGQGAAEGGVVGLVKLATESGEEVEYMGCSPYIPICAES